MRLDPAALPDEVLAFVTERQLATLTTIRADGSPHVVPVGFTYEVETRLARVITGGDSVKVRNADRPGAVGAICQLEGARWITLSGPVRVDRDPTVIADAVVRYADRYRTPRENPRRVVLLMDVTAILASLRFAG